MYPNKEDCCIGKYIRVFSLVRGLFPSRIHKHVSASGCDIYNLGPTHNRFNMDDAVCMVFNLGEHDNMLASGILRPPAYILMG